MGENSYFLVWVWSLESWETKWGNICKETLASTSISSKEKQKEKKSRKTIQKFSALYVLRCGLLTIKYGLLRYGLHHSYADKNKYLKCDIAVEFETLATISDPFINQSSKETFMNI